MIKQAVISGGSGLVGQSLSKALAERGVNVTILSRSTHDDTEMVKYINWSEQDWMEKMPEADIIFNLAGATLNKRWTTSYKETIMNSRVDATRKLKTYLERSNSRPFFINASAVGYYPTAKRLTYTEKDVFLSHDFLSDVVHHWEQEALAIKELVPVARARFGVVLAKDGGALPVMAKPYQLGIGGRIAGGQQIMSWIHIDDLVHALLYIVDQQLTGIFNCTAPQPVTQAELGQTLSQVLRRPHWTNVPEQVMNTVLGEQAVMVTHGQRVLPKRLLDEGFMFDYPDIQSALKAIYHD